MSFTYSNLPNVDLAAVGRGLERARVTTDGIAQTFNQTIEHTRALGIQMQGSGELNFKTCEETAKSAPLFRLEHGEPAAAQTRTQILRS
jgi:hypothetical protein